ncbi:MAG: sigma factor [Peptostreptococcales bacterium]
MEQYSELTELVLKAKNNEDELNLLIHKYKPFIASELSKIENKSIDSSSDELMTTGMLAFAEAVQGYNREKGAFINLARIIIRQRVIDYYRKEKANPVYGAIDENHMEVNEKSVEKYYEQMDKDKRVEVIHEYKKELSYWNVDFIELAKSSPKSKKLKDLYKEMSRYIYEHCELLVEVKKNKRLPIQKLSDVYGVNRKKIERGRSFIIACMILMDPRFIYLSDYIE